MKFTLAELDCHRDPDGWGKWYTENDKTREQPGLPGFEKCRDCVGTGWTPGGPLAPMTGFPCETCQGQGLVPEGNTWDERTVEQWETPR